MAENIIATFRVPGLYRADPQLIFEELKDLGEDVGEFKPEQIVERARDERTELHKCFDWNDTRAAEKWRLHQAVQLTSNLVFKREVKEDGSVPPPIRIINRTESGGYALPEKTFKVHSEYEALLQRAWAELHVFKRKYSALKELDEILALID